MGVCAWGFARCVAGGLHIVSWWLSGSFQCWLLEGCWLLVARVPVEALRQGWPPLWPELPACESTVRACVSVCGCLQFLFVFAVVGVCVCCCCGCGLLLLLCLWVVCLDIVGSALRLSFNSEPTLHDRLAKATPGYLPKHFSELKHRCHICVGMTIAVTVDLKRNL